MENTEQQRPLPEMWAGVECTIARIGDTYSRQLERSGHLGRLDDFDRFAELGITALRFPVLWEMVAPEGLESADWSWTDLALARLRELGIRPIVGLVHHGSGPRSTSLLDERFGEKLAVFAAAVAARYPWVEAYTPVNEPLTTARFSGLYGQWYPHGRDERSFVRCLLNQCRGVVLAMEAIRQVNPGAALVQTDDLGKVFSTSLLAYQADFENERRWLTWDLLCGSIDAAHPNLRLLQDGGATDAELAWFRERRCPPDLVGINHYLSSNRYLDEHLERYPDSSHGGNGRHRYADVLAARAVPDTWASPEILLMEAWERYRLPLAVTEMHNGCTREEQLRWDKYVWDGALRAQQRGAQVEAVTAWSLLGAFDWDSLLTEERDSYEPGVFDIRGPKPRPTALAGLIRELAAGEEPSHPALASPGWWQRADRFHYGHKPERLGGSANLRIMPRRTRPVLITGATGTLGQAFARLCVIRGLEYRLLRRSEMDVAEPASVREVLRRLRPWAIVNAAGYVRVDDAESDCERCFRENTTGPTVLAAACSDFDAHLLTFSSDLVFDGMKGAPYVESDPVSPLNEYGRSKAAAEVAVLQLDPRALIVRTSAFFGPWDRYNFVFHALATLRSGVPFLAAEDAYVAPTYVPDLVQASLDLLIDGESGIWHLSNGEGISWAGLARLAATKAGLPTELVHGVPQETLRMPAPRPLYSVLGSERGQLLPPLQDAVSRFLCDCEVLPQAAVESSLKPTA